VFPPQMPFTRSGRVLGPLLTVLALTLSCSLPQPGPPGVTYEFDSAKDMFKRGQFDRALEFCHGPATASPPNAFTERAQVLQVVIYGGQMKAYLELADSYQKGVDATKNPHFTRAYTNLRQDYLQAGSRLTLGLGDVAHRITETGAIPKEVTLEAPYPTTEGPTTLAPLAQVEEGGWLEPAEQEAVARDAQLKGIDDALAEIIGGNRAKARAELTAGPVKLDGASFALYLGRQLLAGAGYFDRKHLRDSTKLRTLCGEADETAKIALAVLKENPNKDKEKAVKKLQDDIKTALKRL
jgi:hypothetical protein